MPSYSYPGVYIEELAPAKAIEGVATFAFGFLIGVALAILTDRLRHRCRRT